MRRTIPIEVVADGGQKKGGACYGSFVVAGFPGEEKYPFALSKFTIPTADNSDEAEAEALHMAVLWAVSGVEARNILKKRVVMSIRSDNESLIKRLSGENHLKNGFIGERVKAIWALLEGIGEIHYHWVPRTMTYNLFGH